MQQIPAASVERGTNVRIIGVFCVGMAFRLPLGTAVTDDTTTQHDSDQEQRPALPTAPLTRVSQSVLIAPYEMLLDRTALCFCF